MSTQPAGYFIYRTGPTGITCARFPSWNSTDLKGNFKPHVGKAYPLKEAEMKLPLEALERKYPRPEVVQ